MRKVAAACDSWLLAASFFLASERSFNRAEREGLNLLNPRAAPPSKQRHRPRRFKNAPLAATRNQYPHHVKDHNGEDLFLYGLADGKWEVKPPVELVPADFPEPFTGINYVRDEMPGNEWLLFVTAASDSWLIAVAFFLGARNCTFSKADRNRLFTLINDLPTLFDIVSEKAKEKPSDCNPSSKRFKPSAQAGGSKSSTRSKKAQGKESVSWYEVCGACGGRESHVDWICCDTCNHWFHDVCVNITPQEAKQAKGYECPYCSIMGKQTK
ncbi:PHD finger protein ALFIN-LIKE 3-like [Hibiscus syriacus]|uniref:PHD finger protein ALFIN-LIKE 3-like n=1 Tax=Hibiscus syriacus TaxID=106335 RepID=UPI0019211D2A|nr:PHD finger protein ALFIN-LIKE 3-like [Hibiscus syriacus]